VHGLGFVCVALWNYFYKEELLVVWWSLLGFVVTQTKYVVLSYVLYVVCWFMFESFACLFLVCFCLTLRTKEEKLCFAWYSF